MAFSTLHLPVLSGLPVGSQVSIYNTGTTTLAALYSDTGLTMALTQPLVVNKAGHTPVFYVPSNRNYDYIVRSAGGVVLAQGAGFSPDEGTDLSGFATRDALETAQDELEALKTQYDLFIQPDNLQQLGREFIALTSGDLSFIDVGDDYEVVWVHGQSTNPILSQFYFKRGEDTSAGIFIPVLNRNANFMTLVPSITAQTITLVIPNSAGFIVGAVPPSNGSVETINPATDFCVMSAMFRVEDDA